MGKNVITFLTIASILASCSTVPKKVTSYDKKKVDLSKQGKFFGKMKVVYDGKKFTDKCTLDFHDSKGEHNVAIDKDGNFKAYANAGKVTLNSVTCYEVGGLSPSDTFTIKGKKMSFDLKSGKKATYIGDMETNWEPGGFNPFVTVVGLLVGWIAVHRSGTDFNIENKSVNSRSLASTNFKHHTSLLKIRD